MIRDDEDKIEISREEIIRQRRTARRNARAKSGGQNKFHEKTHENRERYNRKKKHSRKPVDDLYEELSEFDEELLSMELDIGMPVPKELVKKVFGPAAKNYVEPEDEDNWF